MSSNDQTPSDATTQPTLQTVLERINAVAGSIAELRKDVDQRFNTVEGEIASLRKDVEQRFKAVDDQITNLRKDVERGFRTVERKMGYFAKDVLERHAEIGDLWERVEELEKKAS